MDLVLPNVKIQLIKADHDEIIITSDVIGGGAWPYDELQEFTARVAKGNGERWIKESFGEDALKEVEIINV